MDIAALSARAKQPDTSRRPRVRQRNATVLLAETTDVDLAGQHIEVLESGGATTRIGYDYLVVAAGSQDSYFGHDDWAEHLYPMKTLAEAIRLREQILCAYERAAECADPAEQARWTTFAIVGAGPTGVEIAGQRASGMTGLVRPPVCADAPRCLQHDNWQTRCGPASASRLSPLRRRAMTRPTVCDRGGSRFRVVAVPHALLTARARSVPLSTGAARKAPGQHVQTDCVSGSPRPMRRCSADTRRSSSVRVASIPTSRAACSGVSPRPMRTPIA